MRKKIFFDRCPSPISLERIRYDGVRRDDVKSANSSVSRLDSRGSGKNLKISSENGSYLLVARTCEEEEDKSKRQQMND